MRRSRWIIGIVVIALLLVLFFLITKDNSKLEDGIYRVQNNSQYPDAYIKVYGGSIQFCNINLDALYKNEMVIRYIYFQENVYGPLTDGEKKKINDSISLNAVLCYQSHELNYNMQIKESKDEYSNMFCKINSVNSFGYLYNTSTKTIVIGYGTQNELSFEK